MSLHRASLLAVASVLAGCGAGAGPSVAPVDTPSSTAAISVSPTPTVNPMASPSIEGRFAVAQDGRELALVCWGDGSPTVILEQIESDEPQLGQLAERYRVCRY